MLAGGLVMGNVVKELKTLAERPGAPVSRMGLFGTLPQHGLDCWPKDAKLIQVEADYKNLGMIKKIEVGIYLR